MADGAYETDISVVSNGGIETVHVTLTVGAVAGCDITGTWTSTDKSYISMTLIQDGNAITGTWTNNTTGCTYSGTGTYNDDTKDISVIFAADADMDQTLCCKQFQYTGNLDDCDSMSLNWTNNCDFNGTREY